MTTFLAQGKQTPNDEIDAWVTELGTLLSATVVAGRDDYLKRSRAMGGWNT